MYTILRPLQDNATTKHTANHTAKHTAKHTGVALVIHGLNLRPERMSPLADVLRQWGLTVVFCSLRGHGANYQPHPDCASDGARLATLRQVSYTGWRSEIEVAYQAAAALAQTADLPLFLVAFSLGGLLGCDLLATAPTVQFDRMVLLAPALALRTFGHWPGWLARWPAFTLRSFAPRAYRANPATSIAAYSALYSALRNLHRHAGPRLNVPTLVLMNPQDELLSLSGIRRFMQRTHLSQWRLQLVNKKPLRRELAFRHLIIDEESVGPHAWQTMLAQIKAHLQLTDPPG